MIGGCARRVDDAWALCAEHYAMLPRDLTAEIGRAYVPGMTLERATPGLYRALARAHDWVLKTFGASAKEPDPGRWERLVRVVRARDEARRAARATPEEAPKVPFRHLRLVD